MTEAQRKFIEIFGPEPTIVAGYRYPRFVQPIRMNETDKLDWLREGYAARPTPPGYSFHIKVAISGDRLAELFVAATVFLIEAAQPLVSIEDDFGLGPISRNSSIYVAFNRRMSWLLEDGDIGFGFIAQAPATAVFVDKFKHVHMLASEPKAARTMIELIERERGILRDDDLHFLSDMPCARASGDVELREDLFTEIPFEPCARPDFL